MDKEEIIEKTISNIKEVKSRGAYVILISNKDLDCKDYCDDKILIPRVSNLFQPLLTIIPLQLIAYEVAKLKEMGYHQGMVSMQGLGYKEILNYLDGMYSLEEAIYILKRETRHFAKRQLTWFRRERDVIWFDKSKYHYDEIKILEDMCNILVEKHIVL